MKYATFANAVVDGIDPSVKPTGKPELLSIADSDDRVETIIAKDGDELFWDCLAQRTRCYGRRERAEKRARERRELVEQGALRRREWQACSAREKRSLEAMSGAFDQYYKRTAESAGRKGRFAETVHTRVAPPGPPSLYCWDTANSSTENLDALRLHVQVESERWAFRWDPSKSNDENREAMQLKREQCERAQVPFRVLH